MKCDTFLYWMLLVLVALSFLVLGSYYGFLPAEDAAILYNYSENLSEYGVISYSPMGSREEGATDFLYMVILALFHSVGFDTFKSALFLNGVGLSLSCFIVSYGIRKYRSLFLALTIVGFATSAGTLSSLVGFSTCFFGASMLLTAFLLHKGYERGFLIAATVCALIRPEVFFVSAVLVGIWILSIEKKRRGVIQTLVFYIVPCASYWVWRTIYFDNILPLPIQIKGFVENENEKNFGYIAYQLKWGGYLSLIGIVAYFVNVSRKTLPAYLVAMALLLVMLSVLYGFSSLSQNVYNRFVYYIPLFSLAILSFILSESRSTLFRYCILFFLAVTILRYITQKDCIRFFNEAMHDRENTTVFIAKNIRKMGLEGRILNTEAGRFSYYSKWDAVDSYGLNTKKFTTTTISESYVREGALISFL